jgi:hypothetical protein
MPGPGLQVFGGQPDKPAVLLFHGLGETSASTWVNPDLMGVSYFYQAPTPSETHRDLGWQTWPRTGVAVDEGVLLSDPLVVGSLNWLNVLRNRGFTVGLFDRPQRTIAGSLPGALEAFDQFLEATRAPSGPLVATPPPVVLMGHSQGGIVLKKVLQDRGTRGRVKAVVTLSTPHWGSRVAGLAVRLGDLINSFLDVNLGPAPNLVATLQAAVGAQLRPVADWLNDQSHAELAPGSAALGDPQAEGPVPGVRYITVGGTNPTFTRVFGWEYSGDSAEPVATLDGPRYHWQADVFELPGVSPVAAAFARAAPEWTPNQGDGLVTDQSARLPWSEHVPTQLNHAEVLYTPALQGEVINRLLPLPPLETLRLDPAVVQLGSGESQRFTFAGPGPVTWTLDGPGSLSPDGVYVAPANFVPGAGARVQAMAGDGSGRTASATITLVGRSPAIRAQRPGDGAQYVGPGLLQGRDVRGVQPNLPQLQKPSLGPGGGPPVRR